MEKLSTTLTFCHSVYVIIHNPLMFTNGRATSALSRQNLIRTNTMAPIILPCLSSANVLMNDPLIFTNVSLQGCSLRRHRKESFSIPQSDGSCSVER